MGVQIDLFVTGGSTTTSTPLKSDPNNPGAALVSIAPSLVSSQFAETVTPLGGAATFTGSAHAAQGAFFTADFFADQAGTAFIEKSPTVGFAVVTPVNGTAGTALAANASLNIKVPVTAGFYRVRFLNGATPQTVVSITSAFNLN